MKKVLKCFAKISNIIYIIRKCYPILKGKKKFKKMPLGNFLKLSICNCSEINP